MNTIAIIEVTERCNLECNFCLRPEFQLPVMNSRTLEKVISHIINSSTSRADFIWHGGEPLLGGLKFFQEVLRVQKENNPRNIILKNNVQTNGVLLTDQFVNFFQDNQFEVGTSLQGTKDIHDSSRVGPNNTPTYDLVTENLSRLSNKPGSILVLTKDILGREEEIYYSLKPHVKGLRISEYFPGGLNPKKESILSKELEDNKMPTPLEMGNSMTRFYNLWKKDSSPIELRPITEIIKSFIFGSSSGCLYSQEVCGKSILGVKPQGDFYTCLRGAKIPNFFLGNIEDSPLGNYSRISEVNRQSRIEILLNSSCGECEFWNYCNGGCPLESWKMYGDLNNKSYYCEGRKMLFELIKEDLNVK